ARIRFRKRGADTEQVLLYCDVNLKSGSLRKAPGFMTLLRSLKPANTFVKAASYLMAGNDFGKIRSVVLEVSHTVFQDDTGVPLRELDLSRWDIQLFGAYNRPIRGFGEYTRQQELMELYAATAPADIQHLPLSMGYHHRNQTKQSHMLLTLRDAQCGATEDASKK
ncbi:MAG: hypothetical protein QF464_12780, partial [Myxococcota bacterium]|nr:hypothetical protein [Myxococcota bacterium]